VHYLPAVSKETNYRLSPTIKQRQRGNLFNCRPKPGLRIFRSVNRLRKLILIWINVRLLLKLYKSSSCMRVSDTVAFCSLFDIDAWFWRASVYEDKTSKLSFPYLDYAGNM